MMHLARIRKVDLACPKHPRFNPAVHNIVKHNCRVCLALIAAQQAYYEAGLLIDNARRLTFLERGTAAVADRPELLNEDWRKMP